MVRVDPRVVEALRRLREMGPWTPPEEPKFRWLVDQLNEIYGRDTRLVVTVPRERELRFPSWMSHYISKDDTIHLVGRYSVVTLLHEYAHALGMGEKEAQEWATAHFFTVWPEKRAWMDSRGFVPHPESV